MLEFYQSLPQKIDPVFFQIGSFSVYWYSIMYLVGFLTVVALTYYRFFKKETSFIWGEIFDFIFYGFWGGVIGGRIGYVIFYNYFSAIIQFRCHQRYKGFVRLKVFLRL